MDTGPAERTSLVLVSMGAPAATRNICLPRMCSGSIVAYLPHAKVYRNLAAEYDRIQQERIAAFKGYAADIANGAYPAASHMVGIDADEMRFLRRQA